MQHLFRTSILQHPPGKRELGKKDKKKDSHNVHIRQRSRNIARAMQRVSVTKILVLAQLTVSTMRSVEVGKYREVYCFHNQINDQSTFWRYDQKERITPALSVMRKGELQQTAQRLFVTRSLKVTLHTTKIKLQFSLFLRYTYTYIKIIHLWSRERNINKHSEYFMLLIFILCTLNNVKVLVHAVSGYDIKTY
jgi:hypothetical protein